MLPLSERQIYVTDRFYDVQALGKDRAFVVGYGGKILSTSDGGLNWQVHPSGVQTALATLKFVDEKHGWVIGQDAVILHTQDGGQTWEKQQSNAVQAVVDPKARPEEAKQPLYLFGFDALDADHAWAVGDRSVLVSTTDGGKTWTPRKVPMDFDTSGGEALAAADPVFYDVKFTDLQTGWIVGEFGKIMHTTDGGQTWHEQEKTLMDGTGIFDLLDLPTLYGVHMLSAQQGIASGIEARIARTVDGGHHWTFDQIESEIPLLDPLFDIVQFPDGSGWAVGAAGQVVRREPGGTSWARAKLGQDVSTWLRAVSFSDEKTGWMVGGYGLIFRTTDGGKSWLPAQG